MACYHPLVAIKQNLAGTGKCRISFIKPGSPIPTNQEPIRIPCGQCIGCRLNKSMEWASRIMHETRFHEVSSFITLTYDDENLPADYSLNKKHFQDFMKRLRHETDEKISYYHCGEYGEEYKRPHYHAIVFGYDVPDRTLWKMSNDIPVYSSNTLDDIWGKGFTSIGNVTIESAAYVARYTMKKITGKAQHVVDEKTGLKPYERICPINLTINEVEPEYATMSTKPAIGKKFVEKYFTDVYPHDEVIVNGHSRKPPRYYDKLLERVDPETLENIRAMRTTNMEKHRDDNSRARLATKEIVKKAQISKLKRNEEMTA